MLISQRSGSKDNVIIADSEIWNGLSYKEAVKAIEELEKIKPRIRKTNYRLRDAVFSSKILGEPFPVYYVNGLPQMIDATHLPIVPEVENIYQQKMDYRLRMLVWAWDTTK
jgi:leucyl-tRNA synthetase